MSSLFSKIQLYIVSSKASTRPSSTWTLTAKGKVMQSMMCRVRCRFLQNSVLQKVKQHGNSTSVGRLSIGVEQFVSIKLTRCLKISSFDTHLDYCILSFVAGKVYLPDFLEISMERLKLGRQCILAAFQIRIQQDLQELDPDLSAGILKGDIAKLYPSHFVYQCPSFDGDSGGAVVSKNGKTVGIHQETVVQAKERLQQRIGPGCRYSFGVSQSVT